MCVCGCEGVCGGGGGRGGIFQEGGFECEKVRVVGMEECNVSVWGEEWEVVYMREGVCVEKVPPLLQQVHED